MALFSARPGAGDSLEDLTRAVKAFSLSKGALAEWDVAGDAAADKQQRCLQDARVVVHKDWAAALEQHQVCAAPGRHRGGIIVCGGGACVGCV